MLTVKGMGGVPLEITNGSLQEMYAYSGEIEANTFVDLKDRIDVRENNLAVSESEPIGSSENVNFDFINNSDESFLLSKKSEKEGSYYYIKLATAKKINGIYTVNPFTKIYETSTDNWSKLQNFDFIKISDSKLLMVHFVISTPTVNFHFKLINIDENGILSVNDYGETRLKQFNMTAIRRPEIAFVRAVMLDESTIGVFAGTNSTNNEQPVILGTKLDIGNPDNISALDFNEIYTFANDGEIQEPLLFEKLGDRIVYMFRLLNFSFTTQYDSLDEIGTLDIQKLDANDGRIVTPNKGVAACILENNILHFHIGISVSYNAKVDCYKLNPDGGFETKGPVPVFSQGIEYGKFAVGSGFGMCVAVAVSQRDGSTGIAHLFGFDGDTLVSLSDDFDLIQSVSSLGTIRNLSGTAPEFLQLITLNISGSPQSLYHFTVGEMITTASISSGKIQGVTKTKISETQKGQVWLLENSNR